MQGKKCVQKIVMEEKVEYEEVQECEHSYNKTCFTSLSTKFEPYQVGIINMGLEQIIAVSGREMYRNICQGLLHRVRKVCSEHLSGCVQKTSCKRL